MASHDRFCIRFFNGRGVGYGFGNIFRLLDESGGVQNNLFECAKKEKASVSFLTKVMTKGASAVQRCSKSRQGRHYGIQLSRNLWQERDERGREREREDAGEYDLDYLEDVGSKVSTESGDILERNGGDADTEKTSVNKSEFGSFAATDGAEERTSSDLSRTAAAPVSVASPTATCNEGTEDDVPCEQTRPGPSRLADGAKDAA